MPNSYRDRIYEKYGMAFQDSTEQFDFVAAERWSKAYDYYLRDWLPIQKDTHILDLGCGAGRLLYFFKHRGYAHVTGVDVSQQQVLLARRVAPNVVHADVLSYLQSNSGMFDLIIGLDIIEHFHKDEVLRFLDASHAALTPGGRFILQTPNAESPWGATHRYNDLTHEVCFNPNALTRLMRLCGFTRIETRELGPVPWGYSLTSTARYLVWRTICLGLKVWNLAETGAPGSGVFTRIFIASGCKL